MLQNLRPIEIILILGIIVLLFGAKKLPQLAKSVGESMKILKKEVHSDTDEPAGPAPTPVPVVAVDDADRGTTPATGATPVTGPVPTPGHRSEDRGAA